LLREGRKLDIMNEPLAELEYVVFDLETTGFDPLGGDQIISFGAVLMRGTEVLTDQCFYRIVNPGRSIPPVVQTLTGITDEMAAGGESLIDVLHDFLAFIGSRLLIAHASGHDKPFLTAALWRTSRAQWTHRILDTMLIARWLTPPARDGYPLDRLLAEAGIEVTVRHHALHDAIMTAQLWSCYQQQIQARHVTTLGDLYAYLGHA
jgi:DNA polymerase-3 subunit epsilon